MTAPTMDTLEPLMTEAEVARLLRIDRSTLCRWRTAGVGPLQPVMVTPTTPRYRRSDVAVLVGGTQ
ncbi:helix-turn-helix transcriptional regulator [Sanguibacter keddieii]|nr:helix-turn-helix domain-containing protein [Sanguibacter keddieii]